MDELGESYKTIVEPKDIEKELQKLWEKLAHEKKTRACLFNLIIYAPLDKRSDYFRKTVGRIIENYPCRILFISHDKKEGDYLKTAVSVIAQSEDSHIACDSIDIGVAGASLEKVPFIVTPHIIPDLPTILLWTEDPCSDNPIFQKLEMLSSRVLFDSESSEDFTEFVKKTLLCIDKNRKATSDLNWARLEAFRDLIQSQFSSAKRLNELKSASSIELIYNNKPSDFFQHLDIQAHYLIFWLASSMDWKFKSKTEDEIHFTSDHDIHVQLKKEERDNAYPGRILRLHIRSGKEEFIFERDQEKKEQFNIHICSNEVCELPIKFNIGKNIRGQSLSKEVLKNKMSERYLKTLKLLSQC